MGKLKHQTNGEINDQVAQDALRYGTFGQEPTHSAMENTEQDPDASATDASPDDDEWDDYGQG